MFVLGGTRDGMGGHRQQVEETLQQEVQLCESQHGRLDRLSAAVDDARSLEFEGELMNKVPWSPTK